MVISGARFRLQPPTEHFWTPKIHSGGPDRSRCTKRELKSLSETHFSIIFARFVNNSRICAIYFLRNSSSFDLNDTLLHEISHALVGPNQGHNNIWKKKALSIGCTGKVYHSLNFSNPGWIKYCSNFCWEQKCYRRKQNLICKICRSEVLYKKNYVSSNSTNVPDKSLG